LISTIVLNTTKIGNQKSNYNKECDKQDQQGKAAFNERYPNTTQQQESAARSPGGPKTKTDDRARKAHH
jgi:hypothetical protein